MSWVEFSEQGCWREVSVAGQDRTEGAETFKADFENSFCI